MTFYEIGILSALLTIFLNYIIGKPGSEFSPYEIFSSYTVWLSKWRLKRLGLYEQYEKQFGFNNAKYEYQLIGLKKDAAIILYNAAEPYFTWERAIGMCSICTGVWVALISGIFWELFNDFSFLENALYLLSIIVISHVVIRLLNKLL